MTAGAVRTEQVRTLYSLSVPVLTANVVNAVIVSATLWPRAPRPLLVAWTGAMALLTTGRLVLRRQFWRARPGPDQARRWAARFVAGSALAGALWGAGGALFFASAGTLSQILIPFVIGGMTAGAAGTLACFIPAFVAYLVPALLPLAARSFALGDRLHVAMGAMLLVYGVGLSAVARIVNRFITEAFRLRFENEALAARLSSAQLDLEENNRTLAARVDERSAALERQSEALRTAQRMESVGRLAGGIAHDFNNLLTVVLAHTSTMLAGTRLEPSARTAVEEVEMAATRGADLVRQLLAFSRRQRLAPRVVDLNEVVAGVERLIRTLLGARIAVQVSLADRPLLVHADPGQIEQVILNLATNGGDAMPEGGVLTIATAAVDVGPDGDVPAGSYVRLRVKDTGVGMDAETQTHAFDPFFTTKPLGKGTGLGLATVYGVVEQSGGHVALHSAPGHGSRFDVYLPRVTSPAEAEAP